MKDGGLCTYYNAKKPEDFLQRRVAGLDLHQWPWPSEIER